MLLLSGPPGSGRTTHILAEFRQALRRRAADIRLLTPTATMAEHFRHELAREGFVLRPNLILTMSQFVSPCVEDLPQIQPAALYLLVERIVKRLAPPEFALVLSTPGFCASLAQTIEEFSAAGCDSQRLERALPRSQFGPPFVAVYREVERELARRGIGLRAARLELAAKRIATQGLAGVGAVWMDGFFALTDPELSVIRSIGAHADLTVTLPASPNSTRTALLDLGFTERSFERKRAEPAVQAFSAPSVDLEAQEIARRILAAGREFREIGIVVRNPDVYLPALRAALERFGIPARFYFSDALGEHGAVRYLSGIVTALLNDWDYAETLAAVRLSRDSPALDRFDFDVRAALPGRGLDGLKALTNDGRLRRLLDDLAFLDPWRRLTLTPSQWAARLTSLSGLARPLLPLDGVGYETASMWRSQASALAAFEAALEEAAQCLDETERITLAEFWPAAQTVLRLSPLRVPGQRRNVVHVLSVFEARQWELPAVFVCGLAEQQFPKRHSQEPLFPDSARQRLAQSGIRVRTAVELEREERFLFELARSRATALLTMSYAEADARGVRNMPSQFIDMVEPLPRTAAAAPPAGLRPARNKPATEQVSAQWSGPTKFSPSGLECFLDCPFQYFARYTLKLHSRPLLPQDRLNFMLQGTIVHETLSEWHRNPQPIEPLFDRVFAAKCAEKAVFMGYRTENYRRLMLDDLRNFCDNTKLPVSPEILTEHQFEMALDDALTIRGRIDRVDKLTGGRALIVDYKYSASVTAKMEKPSLLQGGLYALAVERTLGLKPAGVFYCGLKKKVNVVGWSDPPGEFNIKSEPLTGEWIQAAADRARMAVDQIRGGRIAPAPESLALCRLCDYADVCRYEGAVAVKARGE